MHAENMAETLVARRRSQHGDSAQCGPRGAIDHPKLHSCLKLPRSFRSSLRSVDRAADGNVRSLRKNVTGVTTFDPKERGLQLQLLDIFPDLDGAKG
jgi:hypothetical protein